ncbi:ornithine cyclodeaminase family protein [Dongia soli]|uniref:Ornithine cyclodeaminase family protein n=1 Tax=Dongia soli TaxID=600628 RepID=A0ABU5EBQ7_9PROT|nr:ornithine cyclodeaminase family protein [Dongia soli]MDY0883810.1 ornithine cyclodeaminase family protein [Dongia soli]
MLTIDAATLHDLADYPGLVAALREMNRMGVDQVERLYLGQPRADGGSNDWLLLPAWWHDRIFGVKLVSVFPGNQAKGLETILGSYMLFDGTNGVPLAYLDGAALTLRKTAANSALAADFLARPDAETLTVIGAGALAPYLAAAHAAIRPIRRILWWNRNLAKAEEVAAQCQLPGVEVIVAEGLEAAVRAGDIVTCATRSTKPVVRGNWLKPGSHLDLVGGYLPEMREADDEAIARAARHYVDARLTTLTVVGDVCQPLAAGLLQETAIIDLGQVARGEKPARLSADEVTWFKSGGGGHEDLAVADYIIRQAMKTKQA